MRSLTSAALASLLVLHLGGLRAQAATAVPAETARVIVGFKADSRLVREQRLSNSGLAAVTVAQRAQARADRLAGIAGVPLQAGRNLGEATQVLHARGLNSAALAQRLARHPDVAFAQIDRPVRLRSVPNDPLYSAGPASGRGPDVGQWYLRPPSNLFRSAANAEGAWAITQGRPDVVVAVLDTGVRFDHIDLSGRLLPGYDMVTGGPDNDGSPGRDNDASDPGDWCTSDGSNSSWHGTKVSGIIGAATNNGIGMAGTAPNVRILPVRVLGQCGGFESDVIAGMFWAAGINKPGLPGSATPAKVLNLSLGSDGACGPADAAAVAEVVASGVSVIVAAGNTAGRAVNSPANCPGALGVLALRHAGSKVGFSDLGPEIAIAAPGGNCINVGAGQPCLYPILSTSNSGARGPEAGGSIFTDSFNLSVGTSFSSPIVAGAVALMLSVRPTLSPAEVREMIRSTARPFPTTGADNGSDPTPVTACVAPSNADQLQCYCNTAFCGAGMLDIAAAVTAALGGLQPRITSPAAVAGVPLVLDGSGSLLGAGRSVRSWLWELVDGGGITSGFSSATNAATVGLTPSAAGTLRVRLTVTDDAGATSSAELSIVVAPAPPPPPPNPPPNPAPNPQPNPPNAGAGGGGGATSLGWLLGLASAATVLRTRTHARPARTRRVVGRLGGLLLAALGAVVGLHPASVLAQAAAVAPSRVSDPVARAAVHGLIVRLKDAPSHESLELGAAQPERERAKRRALAADEAGRWQRVLSAAGLSTSADTGPRMQPVGRDQQLLSLSRPMAPAQARDLAQRLAARPEVAWVESNVRERRLSIPNDPQFNASNPGQWWLKPATGSSSNVITDRLRGVPGFQTAWQLPGGTGIGPRPAAVVAVLDTGITCHPDLGNLAGGNCIGGSILPGYDFVGGSGNPGSAGFDPNGVAYANDGDGRDADPRDPGDWVSAADKTNNPAAFADCEVENSSWHGTVISGILAAQTNNGLGVSGIHWAGRVLPVRVAGKCGASVADIVDGMRWAAGLAVSGVPLNPNPARILSISFGGSAACGSAYQTAIDELRAQGVVVVAAAGNEFAAPTRPANCSGVVGVVSLNRDGFKSNYSNFGAALTNHGVATVGGDDGDGGATKSGRWGTVLGDSGITTVNNTGTTVPQTADYARLFGTSFSAPVVAGALALMLSVNPNMDWTQLTSGLRLTARPHVVSSLMLQCSSSNPGRCICTTATCGAGILDANQALLYAANPGSYVAPVRTPQNIDSTELQDAINRLGTQDRGASDPSPPPPDPAPSGGGGGASSGLWLLGLALAVGLLRRQSRRIA